MLYNISVLWLFDVLVFNKNILIETYQIVNAFLGESMAVKDRMDPELLKDEEVLLLSLIHI